MTDADKKAAAKAAERTGRMAAALRTNLRKRKTQARGEGPPVVPEPTPES